MPPIKTCMDCKPIYIMGSLLTKLCPLHEQAAGGVELLVKENERLRQELAEAQVREDAAFDEGKESAALTAERELDTGKHGHGIPAAIRALERASPPAASVQAQ